MPQYEVKRMGWLHGVVGANGLRLVREGETIDYPGIPGSNMNQSMLPRSPHPPQPRPAVCRDILAPLSGNRVTHGRLARHQAKRG
jgi:hypothetical protein